MQEAAHQNVSEVAREVRTLAQGLKEAVKKNEALDKEVEFRRKSLRKQHLKLLLLHPNSKEAKDAETHIWMQTSYQFISVYKQRIAAIDRTLFSTAPHNQNSSGQERGGGHVEYRKILARFRQFLAEEEKFYIQLLIRFRMQFDLTEAHPALVKTGILSAGSEDVPQSDSGRNVFPEKRETPPKSNEERETRLATFTKLLVCLGDIARYREQYNDGGGRPRAGHEEGFSNKVGRGGKKTGLETLARPRNYSRAQAIYEQARLLVPNDGNASHQLAILSSYQKDMFGSLLHYYRALCVCQPYDTASDNLNTVLKKALEQYKAVKKGSKHNVEDAQPIPKLRVDRFKEWVVVLHGLWFLDTDESAARASKHARNVVAEFESLIIERILPSATVSEVIVLAVGALWKLRMIRDSHIRTDRMTIEPLMASHVLELSRILFVLGMVQLSEKPEDIEDKEDLAQHITAAFRRTLPAIRIASKWLCSNLSYVETAMSSAATPAFLSTTIKDFWKAYAAFFTSLNETFPLSKLPPLKSPLEEDVDMSGFSPIKKAMFKRSAPTESGQAPGQDEVHPNEEYLMRISDLLGDAKQIIAFEKSPISFNNGQFVCIENALSMTSVNVLPPANRDRHPPRITDDDNIIREAFNVAIGTAADNNEEDEIVWSPPKIQFSPQQKVIQPPQPYGSSTQAFTPVLSTANLSPPRQPQPSSITTSTTAQDLLHNVLGASRASGDLAAFKQNGTSSAPQASLLFGSGSLNAPTKSIWSSSGGGLGPIEVPRNAPIQPSQHPSLAPGHGRSQSFSQPWSSSISQNTDYMNASSASASLSMGSLIGNYNHQLSRHQSMPVSSMHPVSPQVVYDSQLSQASVPAAHIQDSRHYGTNLNADVSPCAASVQRTPWNT